MISLPPLPYEYDALEPAMSADTLHYHHDKHHAAYVKKTNNLAEKAGLGDESLENIVAGARAKHDAKLFNNAAQAWNHAFFWHSMAPEPGKPGDALTKAIEKSFGGLSGLKEAFVEEGAGHFGSGWVWLVAEGGTLSVTSTHDAETLTDGASGVPILVCDVWEHAYYLDRQNDRKAYLKAWFDKLANWDFASEQFDAAGANRHGYRFAVEEMA
jgi:superoxide dismutase, Fe-Mn family